MMAQLLPYLRWFPARFRAATAHMSDDAELAYRRMIDAIWESGGKWPADDDVKLARTVRFHLRKWRRIRPELLDGLDLFRVVDGHWWQDFLAELIEDARQYSRRQASNRRDENSSPKRMNYLDDNPLKSNKTRPTTVEPRLNHGGAGAGQSNYSSDNPLNSNKTGAAAVNRRRRPWEDDGADQNHTDVQSFESERSHYRADNPLKSPETAPTMVEPLKYIDRDIGNSVQPKYQDSLLPTPTQTSPHRAKLPPAEPAGYSATFEAFWNAYPRDRGSKSRAWSSWRAKQCQRLDQAALIAKVHAYARSGKVQEGYVQNASTWINGRMWEVDYLPPRAPGGRQRRHNASG